MSRRRTKQRRAARRRRLVCRVLGMDVVPAELAYQIVPGQFATGPEVSRRWWQTHRVRLIPSAFEFKRASE